MEAKTSANILPVTRFKKLFRVLSSFWRNKLVRLTMKNVSSWMGKAKCLRTETWVGSTNVDKFFLWSNTLAYFAKCIIPFQTFL